MMKYIDQQMVYDSVGQKIKEDLYAGNAVVLFAYGLSGSGKTFTVFGMDDVNNKSSWFYHAEPDKMWGIFPRLGACAPQSRARGAPLLSERERSSPLCRIRHLPGPRRRLEGHDEVLPERRRHRARSHERGGHGKDLQGGDAQGQRRFHGH